jgi:hypothetical protein
VAEVPLSAVATVTPAGASGAFGATGHPVSTSIV